MHIAALTGMGQPHGASLHRVLDTPDNQFCAELPGAKVAEVGHFGEIVSGVDHQQWIRQAAGTEGFFGAFEHDQRILAAGKQQGRALESGGNFPQDEDGFLLQRIQMAVAQGVQRFGHGIHSFLTFSHAGRIPWPFRPPTTSARRESPRPG